MAALDHTDTLFNLKKKGFRKDETHQSGDHIRLEFWYQNKLTRVRTKLSHNKQDINNSLIKLMSKQIYLTNKEFVLFAKCDLTQEGYEKLLKERGYI
jgi:hypothetical protein